VRKILLGAALLLAAVMAIFTIARSGRSGAPAFVRTSDQNVLLITIDTLRADALGSYGGPRTPVLDRLAAQGLRFDFAHAHAVVTLPSHATILTGQYPFQHGVRDNAGFRLGDDAVTIAEAAQQKGFATGAFVGAFPLDRRFGVAQGFDEYDDLSGREVAPAEFEFSERPAAEVVAAARAWIARQQGPWLAWVHLFDPHSPYAPPAQFQREFAGNPYAGEVRAVDAALGPLLEDVRSGPRPTTVIVTADHGEGLGDHGEATHGIFAYESTLRVPLILAQVGAGAGASGGATSTVPVRHVDIAPTIAELTGLELPDGLPGRTLAAAVDGEAEARPAYFEAMTAMLKRGWAPLRGVLVGREKYIDLPLEELYDLDADAREERNLAPARRDRVRVMMSRLEAFGAAMPGEETPETGEVRARLQALGYLSGSAPRKPRYTEEDDPKRLIDVDRLMIDGIELHRAGRAREAADAYRRVLARRPDMDLAYRRLAFILWESGATADAIATLREALDRNGPDPDIEIRLGTYLAETGAAADAIPMLERPVAADPENTEALNALGIAYAQAGRHGDALRTFERILTLLPRDPFALENLATVHLQRGDLVAAGEAFARAAANDPTSSRARAGLGVVAMKSGRRSEAIDHWRRAVELDAGNFDALYNLATELVNAGRHAEARPYLEQFVRTAPRAFYAADIDRVRDYLARPGSP
jgi:arylsulfatase A-like enzyme/Tfp pilus assembly protein PilF